MKKYLLSIFLALLAFGIIQAQYQIGLVPRVSPDKSEYKKIGFTEIEIKYGAPRVNNRQLQGNLIPYDKIWRAGANNATTISISNDIEIDGQLLSAGVYSFFIQAQQNDSWIAIFNKTDNQWGAFRYDPTQDALRTTVEPMTATFKDELSYSIDHEGFDKGRIILNWGELKIELPFKLNYLNQFVSQIVSKIDAVPENLKWVVYIQGAEHLQKINSRLDQALLWLLKAEDLQQNIKDWNTQFYPLSYVKGHLLWTKAKTQAQLLNYVQAIESVEKMSIVDPDHQFYSRKKESENIDKLITEWKEKL